MVVADGVRRPYWEAKFRRHGHQVKRRIGPAWLVRPDSPEAKPNGASYKRGAWTQRRGHPAGDALTHDAAVARLPSVLAAYQEQAASAAAKLCAGEIEATRPRTFRELAQAWRVALERKGAAKPSTLVGYDAMLAEPTTPLRRGNGTRVAYIMTALGDIPAVDVTVGDVEALLERIAATGATARTVEKHRMMVRAILNFGIKETTRALAGASSTRGHDYGLSVNAAQVAEGPRDRSTRTLVYYLPEEIEAIARALEQGLHRHAHAQHRHGCAARAGGACDCDPAYRVGRLTFESFAASQAYLQQNRDEAELRSDLQDGAAVRISAYTGVRLGELLALRWSDVEWSGSALTVSRAISAGQETTTKSGKIRRVPLPDQALAALDALSRRGDFTAPAELVICNVVTGRPVDDSALRRRYKSAQVAAGVHELRWHDLRHTYGSLLAASGEEMVTIKAAMGHANISTTEV